MIIENIADQTDPIARFRKIARIAEAGLWHCICIHDLCETGMNTATTNHVSAILPKLHDGNKAMTHLPGWRFVKSANLQVVDGKWPVLKGLGLGIELDADQVKQAADLFDKNLTNNG